MKKTPVIILAGFLGSGKTTTLNHILRSSNGKKIGVIVNDFGEVNIDSLLVSRQTDNTMELSGGCICCQMNDGGLDEILATFSHPNSKIDAIVIEASGIAEPIDLRKLILYSSNKSISMNGVVYIVDAKNIIDNLKNHPKINNHIAAADIIVLNKIDLVDKNDLVSIKSTINKINSNSIIIQTKEGRLNPGLLFDIDLNTSKPEQLSLAVGTEHSKHDHLHDNFDSISFSSKKPLSPKKFNHFIETLPSNVYRLKGIIYYGMKGFEQKIIIHKVGSHISQSAEEWQNDETPMSNLVAIGIDINKQDILNKLKVCIDKEPENISPEDMVDIMRLRGL